MLEPATPPARRPRLNPFPFPSDTTLRFVLLAIFVICGSARMWGGLSDAKKPVSDECVTRVWAVMTGLASHSDAEHIAATARNEMMPLQARCAARSRPGVYWQVGGMGLVVLLAVVLYYLYPGWKIRTGRLQRFSASDVPEMEQELRNLTESARLPNPPIFVWNPLAAGLPVAFGGHGKCYVALSGSFIAQYFYGDRDAFRAIMRHELAHIQNRDVHKAYFTLSLWLAFVATSLLPVLAMCLWRLTDARQPNVVPLLVESVVWMVVVVLAGLAVLRARECYADVQASAGDPGRGIDRVLATLTEPVGDSWRRYLRFHPSPRRRSQIVEDPSRLLKLGIADAFGIGVAAWSVEEVLKGLALPFFPADLRMALLFTSLLYIIVPAAIFVFAIGAIGIGVWRSAFASLAQGARPSSGTAWLGAAFVAGTLPGIILSAALQPFEETAIPFHLLMTGLQLKVSTYVIFFLACLFIFPWISAAASVWFDVVVRTRSPRPILLITVMMATILALGTLAMANFIILYSFLTESLQQDRASRIAQFGLTAGAWTLLASLIAWSFPLASLGWQKKRVTNAVAPWVFLDHASPALPERLPLRAQQALLAGIVNGLLCCLLWELVFFRASFPPPIGNWIGPAIGGLLSWTRRAFGSTAVLMAGSAVIFQALAAAIAAARAKRLSVTCGLFAASVAGVVVAVGNTILYGFGPDATVRIQALVALQLMGLGAVVALPTALLVAWSANLVRRAFLNAAVSRAPPARPPIRFERA